MAPQTLQVLALASVFIAFAVAEMRLGRFNDPRGSRDDAKLDIAGGAALLLGSLTVLNLAQALAGLAWPDARQTLADWPVWLMLLCFFLADDLVQYLWHRLCHTSVLWPLHRPHHTAPYVNVRVAFRNNAFYYLTLPGLWLSGLLVYLGMGWVYVGYTTLKLTVIMSAHSAVRWDEFLFRRRALRPVAWVLERLISTPATHAAHHALSEADGIGRHTGNYGNLLFIWDVLLGTAYFTRRYPKAYGLPETHAHTQAPWLEQWLYPAVQRPLLLHKTPNSVHLSETPPAVAPIPIASTFRPNDMDEKVAPEGATF
ncbi:sterol desaturase family protein [Ideonella paludis]|uniref:Sterol desaturase family protein n=1 Tax=Ideonella paludis TaxID=1233411 RepID=A0ABS5DY14_9BURK|nr:sterol desaturase family protein [Ideonella paludis]MBQ0936040.1 sterol desaturase family protein [Ideonella paludis]